MLRRQAGTFRCFRPFRFTNCSDRPGRVTCAVHRTSTSFASLRMTPQGTKHEHWKLRTIRSRLRLRMDVDRITELLNFWLRHMPDARRRQCVSEKPVDELGDAGAMVAAQYDVCVSLERGKRV